MSAPKRIQRKRSKGWRMPDNTVYVGRPTVFGNPFTIAQAEEVGYIDPRATTVGAYRDWINGNPWACGSADNYESQRQSALDHLHELRGKDLACWCRLDQPCHADVLLEMANKEPCRDLRK